MRNSSGSKPEKNARKLAKILLAKRNLLFAMRHLAIREAESFYSQSGVFLFAVRPLLFATRHAASLQRSCNQGTLNSFWILESSRGEADLYQSAGLDIMILAGTVPSAASARPSPGVSK